MTKMSVAEAWDTYRADVVNPEASPNQITETRRAFFSGAWVVLCMVERVGEPDYTEADAVRVLEDVKAELLGFKDRVGEGDL